MVASFRPVSCYRERFLDTEIFLSGHLKNLIYASSSETEDCLVFRILTTCAAVWRGWGEVGAPEYGASL